MREYLVAVPKHYVLAADQAPEQVYACCVAIFSVRWRVGPYAFPDLTGRIHVLDVACMRRKEGYTVSLR